MNTREKYSVVRDVKHDVNKELIKKSFTECYIVEKYRTEE